MLTTKKSVVSGTRRPHRLLALPLVLLLVLVFGATASAQDTTPRDTRTWTEPNSDPKVTFTFSTPEIFNSCSTRGDRIYTIGLQTGWRLEGTVSVRQPNQSQVFITVIPISQTVNLDLLVPYPPVSQWQDNVDAGNREIHVDLSITVLDSNGSPVSWIGGDPERAPGVLGPGGQDWDVFCVEPPTPDITIKKYTNGADADDPTAAGVPLIAAGAPVTWTYRLTNTGPVDIPFAEITVTDNIPGINPVFTSVISGDLKGDGNGLLQPGEVWEYTATGTAVNLSNPPGGQGLVLNTNACQQGNVNAPGRTAYTNIGTVVIPNTSASDPSSYCNPEVSVAVAKTAVTSYTRTYTWEIAKRVSPSVVNLFEGQNANVDYTVQVTRTGFVDSGWQVSGVISVTNNSQAAVTLNSVTDSISGVGNVTVTCPVGSIPGNLGAGQTLVCSYTSALPDGATRTNTATATYNTSSTATGTAVVSFGAPTTVVSGSVSVQDVYNGGAPETLGTDITSDTTIPYTRAVVCGSDLNYVNGVASYPRLNTAAIVETNQSANASMTVNCYRPSVSLTPVCTDDGRLSWRVTGNQSGAYVAQLVSNGAVIETVNLTLTANQPETFTFDGVSTTPNFVRIIYQNIEVLTQEGPEPCVSGLSAALAPVCTRLGDVEWIVLTNRSGEYVAQLMSGNVVVESINLTLTEGVETQFLFREDSDSPRLVRLLYQGSEYAQQDGLTTPCTPTSLPPSDEPNLPVMTNFIYLPSVNR